ncbi:MAG: hypothetical protein JWM04_1409, partial [Verrucomicrobiales bacterium]|nr:hypothetical protein [Verrucomicrobiales bacterium]
TLQTYLTNGPTSKKINIVFLSEGYTTADLAHFPTDARAMLSNILGNSPLNEYTNCFNAFGIAIASTQSGSDHPSRSIFKNTYFNSSYDTSGLARLISIDGTGLSRANALLASMMPQYDIVAIIVNDTEYGGSGGQVLIASIHSSSPEIAAHEMGHTFAALGDEYGSPYPGYPDTEEPNTTRETNRDLIKWASWIPDFVPVPTPVYQEYTSVIGLFEGAHYHTTGWYRPKYNCKMQTLGVPFCEVCSETLVKSIYSQIHPIDSLNVDTNTVFNVSTNKFLTVFGQKPSTHTLSFKWYVNNVLQVPTNSTIDLSKVSLIAGINSVKVDVADETTLVRNDPTGLLRDTRTWQVKSASAQTIIPSFALGNSDGQLNLNWTPASGFNLESSPIAKTGLTWNTALSISNQTQLAIPMTNPATFFRLHKP